MWDKISNPKTIAEIKEELAPIKGQLCEVLTKLAHDIKFYKAPYKTDEYNPNPEQLVQCLNNPDTLIARVVKNPNGHNYSIFIGIQHDPKAGMLYLDLTPEQAKGLQDSLTDADYRIFCEHSLRELIDTLRSSNSMFSELLVRKTLIEFQELLWELQSIPPETNFTEFCPIALIEKDMV